MMKNSSISNLFFRENNFFLHITQLYAQKNSYPTKKNIDGKSIHHKYLLIYSKRDKINTIIPKVSNIFSFIVHNIAFLGFVFMF